MGKANKKARIISLLLTIILCIGVLPCAVSAAGDEWAEGKIRLEFGWIDPNSYRDAWQFPSRGSASWLRLPYYSNGAATLLDAEGNVVETYTGEARHVFSGLKAGTYTIRLTILDSGRYEIVHGVVNGGPIAHLITTYESQVEVVEGNADEILRWVVLEYKAYGLKTDTELGAFANGTTEKTYYQGYNSHYENTDPSTVSSNPVFNTHDGIYYGDSASQYAGMNTLEEPVISEELQAAGYRFFGWKLDGDATGRIYTTDEALAITVRHDLLLHAVFERTGYTVTWKNGIETLETDEFVRENTAPDYGGNVPTRIVDGEAHTFIGWSKDPNAVYGLSVLDLPNVTGDVTYYAIFQKPAQDVKGIDRIEKTGTVGNTDIYTIFYSGGDTYQFTITNGKDGKDGGGGSGAAGKDGRGIDRIEKTGSDGDVDIYTIYYTDGTTFVFTIANGRDKQKPFIPDALNSIDHFAYIIGYPNGNVHPEGTITRAEVATIFFRLLKDEIREANFSRTNSFSDVGEGQWFSNAISTMARMGVVKGYEDGTFRPNEPITRAEFAAIAARFDQRAHSSRVIFTDTYGHWAANEISRAAVNGWINGYPDGSFKPDQQITRAETMALVNRMLNRDPEDPSDLLNDMIRWPDNMDTNKWYYIDVQEATNSHDYERNTKLTEKWTELQAPKDWAALEN